MLMQKLIQKLRVFGQYVTVGGYDMQLRSGRSLPLHNLG